MSCQVLKILESTCPCLLKYENCGKVSTFNLEGASVKPFEGGFNIYGIGCGLKVSDQSDFTWEDVDALICECSGGGGPSGAEDDPVHVDLSSSMIACTDPVERVLPVRLVCSDETTDVTLACSSETGELVYVDTSQFPPQVLNFDGTVHEFPIRSCENDYKWVETEFCGEDGITLRVVCWNVIDPAGTSTTIWVLPDGSIVDSEPAGIVLCRLDCSPFVAQFIGDPTNTEPYNKINVNNPNKCCTATVVTSAGTFTVDGGSVFCLDFECDLEPEITIIADDPQCLEKIKTTIQRTK